MILQKKINIHKTPIELSQIKKHAALHGKLLGKNPAEISFRKTKKGRGNRPVPFYTFAYYR